MDAGTGRRRCCAEQPRRQPWPRCSSTWPPTMLRRSTWPPTVAARAAGGGNPVIPLLAEVRSRADARRTCPTRPACRASTSQDVLDTALVLVLRDGHGRRPHRPRPPRSRRLPAGDDLPRCPGARPDADPARGTDHAGRPVRHLAAGAAGRPPRSRCCTDTHCRSPTAAPPAPWPGSAVLAGPVGGPAAHAWSRTWAHGGLGLPVEPGPLARGQGSDGPLGAGRGPDLRAALGTVAADVADRRASRDRRAGRTRGRRPGRIVGHGTQAKPGAVRAAAPVRAGTPALAAQVLTAAGPGRRSARGRRLARGVAGAATAAPGTLVGSSRIAAELLTGLVVDPQAAARNLATSRRRPGTGRRRYRPADRRPGRCRRPGYRDRVGHRTRRRAVAVTAFPGSAPCRSRSAAAERPLLVLGRRSAPRSPRCGAMSCRW